MRAKRSGTIRRKQGARTLMALGCALLLVTGGAGVAWTQETGASGTRPTAPSDAEAYPTLPDPAADGSSADELEQQRERVGFYDLQELIRLIETAREAGFTDEQIRELTIEDEEGRIVNAWNYLQAQLRKRRQKEERMERLRNKEYLTVQDVIDELAAMQPDDLTRLRKELLFED